MIRGFVVDRSILLKQIIMGIFKAIGLGIAIVVLKLLVPDVMSGIEATLVSFFKLTQLLLAHMAQATGG